MCVEAITNVILQGLRVFCALAGINQCQKFRRLVCSSIRQAM